MSIETPSDYINPSISQESKKPDIDKILSFCNLPKGRERWVRQELASGFLVEADLLDTRRIEQMEEDHPVATHEAGHALMVIALGGSVLRQSVIPDGGSRGHVLHSPNPFQSFDIRLISLIRVCVAGMVAEEMFGINDHQGCGSDLSKAYFYASVLKRAFGMPNTVDGIMQSEITQTRGILYSMGSRRVKQAADNLTRLRLIA